jgi:Sulfatase
VATGSSFGSCGSIAIKGGADELATQSLGSFRLNERDERVSDQMIDRTELPIRRPPFRGVVKRTLDGSQPDWDYVAPLSPPQGAPNILLILTDDAGFGNLGTFGGPIRTPALDRLAAGGLKYNGFHVTAMCSPTRAALMTGRNHNAVGFGMVSEFAGPFPGYSAMLPKDCQPFVKTLQGNGYSTACFGKWHMTPDHMQGPGRPFDRWPNARLRLLRGLPLRRARPQIAPGRRRLRRITAEPDR